MERTGGQERRVGCERRVLDLGRQRQESGYREGVPVERRVGARFRAGKAEECIWRRPGARREELAPTVGCRVHSRAEECLWRGRGARREELAAKEGCSI